MKEQPQSMQIYGYLALYDMHTRYFIQALDAVSDEDALKRLNTAANHMAWLAGSMVQERFELYNQMGGNLKPSANERFKGHQGIIDGADYPSLMDFKADWHHISPLLKEKMLKLDDDDLEQQLDFPDMGVSYSMFEMITFNTYRESNIIGQLVLWRRLLGYSAIKYD